MCRTRAPRWRPRRCRTARPITAKIREYTTLDLPPAAIHTLGLSPKSPTCTAQMLAAMRETGFKGDFPAFLQFLRSDPRFTAKTPQELLNDAAWIAKEFDGKASLYFGLLPRARFAIRPVPPTIWRRSTPRGAAATAFPAQHL